MLTAHRIVQQHAVVQIVAAQQEPRDADPGVEQQARGDKISNHPGRHHFLRILEPENERVKNNAGTENDPRLETSARPEISVELHVEREQEDQGNHELCNDVQDQVVFHSSSSPLFRLPRIPSRSSTPTPAVKITVTSPRVS